MLGCEIVVLGTILFMNGGFHVYLYYLYKKSVRPVPQTLVGTGNMTK